MGGGTKGKGPRRPPPSADQMAARLDRAAGERMFFMGRVASPAAGGDDGGDEAAGGGGGGGAAGVLAPFVVTGLSGSVYTIHLSTEEAGPSAADVGGVGIVAKCNCRDYIFRRAACKHILFILLRVLNIPKARLLAALSPPASPLTHSEVTAAAAASRSAAINPFYAPPKALADRLRAIAGDFSGGGGGGGGDAGPPPAATPRVPAADDDCPICYEAFGEVASAADPAVVYCRRGCGGGVHADCFRRWEANAAGAVTCVYCRAPWGAPPAPAGRGGGGTAAGNVLDASRGGRARLIDLGDYLPDGPPPTRKGGKAKKKGATAAAGAAGGSGSGGGKRKGKAKADARPAAGGPSAAVPAAEADANADVAVVEPSPPAAPTRSSTRSGGKAAKATAAAATAAVAAPPAPRVTRSGMATRSRRAAPVYVELSDSDGDDGGGGAADPSDASADDGDTRDGDASPSPPPPKRSRRSRR